MTQQEFIAYVKLYPSQVNVKYSENLTGPSIIDSISVPVLDLAGNSLTEYLQQVQQLIVPLTTGGNVTLSIVSRSQSFTTTLTGVQVGYFIFDVQQITVTRPTSALINQGLVALSPYVRNLAFNSSPYNVLQGSLEKPRTSDYIMKADRSKTTGISGSAAYTGPSNINLLLAGSASKAEIQDSSYSNTGWTNSRYEGSKTNKDTYKVESAVNGTPFLAAIYPFSTSDSYIKFQQSSSAAFYTDYFYAGPEQSPKYSVEDTYWTLANVLNNATTSTLTFNWGLSITTTPLVWAPMKLIPPGTLIKLGYYQPEIVKVITSIANPLPTGTAAPSCIVTVQRSYYGTVVIPVPQASRIYTLPLRNIYQLDGSKLSEVVNRKLQVKDSGEIIYLDKVGRIVGPTPT